MRNVLLAAVCRGYSYCGNDVEALSLASHWADAGRCEGAGEAGRGRAGRRGEQGRFKGLAARGGVLELEARGTKIKVLSRKGSNGRRIRRQSQSRARGWPWGVVVKGIQAGDRWQCLGSKPEAQGMS